MRFKVGDQVRVRTWEDLRREFPSKYSENELTIRCGFNNKMKKRCGTVVTIQRVRESTYAIEEDEWSWTDDMLESCTVDEERDTPKVSHVVRLSEIFDGRRFSVAGIKMYKMYKEGAGYMCIFADPVFMEAYETSQNYAKSTIH
ncbi:MAG: hypothetical protein IKY71_03775, partial [Bacteroidaceae bacterium]|nr:hypothetical protein [Bacteroidaceae bacterium]